MADTKINPLLSMQPGTSKTSAAASLRTAHFSRRTYNINYRSADSFNTVLDRASTPQPQSNAPATRDVSKTSASEPTTRTRPDNFQSKQSNQSTQTAAQKPAQQTDNSPKDVKPIEEVEEVENASANAVAMPIDMSALFSTML